MYVCMYVCMHLKPDTLSPNSTVGWSLWDQQDPTPDQETVWLFRDPETTVPQRHAAETGPAAQDRPPELPRTSTSSPRVLWIPLLCERFRHLGVKSSFSFTYIMNYNSCRVQPPMFICGRVFTRIIMRLECFIKPQPCSSLSSDQSLVNL